MLTTLKIDLSKKELISLVINHIDTNIWYHKKPDEFLQASI